MPSARHGSTHEPERPAPPTSRRELLAIRQTDAGLRGRTSGLASSAMADAATGPVIVIDSVAALQDVARFGKGRLVLQLPGLPAEEAAATGERLNRYRTECGCSAGARLMMTAFGLSLTIAVLVDGASRALFLHAPLAFPAAVVGAGVGKARGIALARRKARREISDLFARLATHEGV